MEHEGKSLWSVEEDSKARGLSSWRDGGAITEMGRPPEGQVWESPGAQLQKQKP